MNKLPVITLLLSIGATASAQDASPAQLDSVTVQRGAMTTSVAPYGQINELLAGLQTYGEGLFRFEFHMKPKDPAKVVATPTLAIQHADFYRPLKIAADGLVELPVLPAEQAKDADIITNQPKGSLQLQGSIELTTPPAALDLAGVRRMVALSGRLKRELLPWYVRPLFPTMSGVRICSAEPGWEMQWRDDKGQLWGVTLPPAAGETDPTIKTPARQCTVLTGQEHWPESARLVAPADARLSIKLL